MMMASAPASLAAMAAQKPARPAPMTSTSVSTVFLISAAGIGARRFPTPRLAAGRLRRGCRSRRGGLRGGGAERRQGRSLQEFGARQSAGLFLL